MNLTFQELVTLVSIVGTGIGTVLVQIYRENRNHRWEEKRRAEEKAEEKAERERVATDLAAKVEAETRHANQMRQTMLTSIEVVGEKAAAAYDIGNHNAEKFDQVHDRLVDLNKVLVKQGEQVYNGVDRRKGPMKVEVVNAPKVEVVNAPLPVSLTTKPDASE